MVNLIAESRIAFRSLRLQPLFTLATVLTLALGVAAVTAVFSALNAIYLKALPYPGAERLVHIWMDNRAGNAHMTVSPAEFNAFQQARSFAQVSAFNIAFFTVNSGERGAEHVFGAVVGSNFFSLIGVRPALGNGFAAVHGTPGTQRVAMISDAFWRSRFAAARDIIGREIRLDGESCTIVGVLPAGYRHPEPGWDEAAQVWVPLAFSERERLSPGRFLRVLATLAPGVTLASAQAELDGIAARLARDQPQHNANWGVRLVSLRDELFGRARAAALLLLVAGTLVLLVVCVNVGNLFLARDYRRRRDFAVRSALGAGRVRLATQVLLESLMVAAAGAALGSMLVKLGESALSRFAGANLSALADFTLDHRVAWFVTATAVLCCLLVGGLPALRTARLDLRSVLAELSRGASSGRGARRARALPIILQMSLTTVLLVCTLLLGRSVLALLRTPTGFQPENVLTFELQAPGWRYPQRLDALRFQQSVLQSLRELPGVASASLVSDLPFTGWNTFVDVRRPGIDTRHQTEYQVVTPDYFATIGMAQLEGRAFTATDDARAPAVAIVNRQLARTLSAEGSILGQRLRVGSTDTLEVQIVGVVGDILDDDFRSGSERRLYMPLAQRPRHWLAGVVRTAGDVNQTATLVRSRLRQLDPEVPVWNVRPLQQMMTASVRRERAALLFVAIFSTLALSLAAVGTYGVIACTVSERRREMGIRSALGARPGQLAGAVLRDASITALIGLVIGSVLALFGTRALQNLLFGVHRFDPLSLAATILLLQSVALASAWLPARRAAQVAPFEALRSE